VPQDDSEARAEHLARVKAVAKLMPTVDAPVPPDAIKRAAANLVKAVAALAAWEPTLGEDGRVKDESVAALLELRMDCRIRLVELDELNNEHADGIARLCNVARRVAPWVLPEEQANRVANWFGRFTEAA
jgi:hypothetical protein